MTRTSPAKPFAQKQPSGNSNGFRFRLLFLILLFLSLAITISTMAYDYTFLKKKLPAQAVAGVLDLSYQESPYLLDQWLAGEWEFYPDQLIFSNPSDSNELNQDDGEFQVLDPRLYGEQNRTHTSHGPINTYALDHTSTEPNPDAEHIVLPYGINILHQPYISCRNASYRLVLTNCPPIDTLDMMLSLTGMIEGNYKVFINGHEGRSLIAPFSYPGYYTPLLDRMEIVIEVSHSFVPLNICPRLSHKGTAMAAIDSHKYRLVGMASALVSAFIIMMLLVFALEPRRFRWHFGIGLLFSVYFIAINLWATGFLSPVTRVIPMYLLYHICSILLQLGFLCAYYTMKKFYPNHYGSVWIDVNIRLLLAALVLYLVSVFIPPLHALSMICYLLIIVAFLLWIIRTWHALPEVSLDTFLFQTGIIILTLGANTAMLYNQYGVFNKILYILPICLFTYIVLVFISCHINQNHLMQKTIELLELEKEASRMQAAMLSSQMRPHFLHNALTSIQEMCYTEPEQAANMIVHLSKYLRKNIDFMDYSDLIPFQGEWEHIENYMYIQHARYGDALNFETYIGYWDFEIPPLSIQPLIENAINYGIRKNSNHGTIRLETFLDIDTVHIRVSNSGPGFDVKDLKPNHSVENIRKRLATFLNGTLTITSDPDKLGTQIEITFVQQHELL